MAEITVESVRDFLDALGLDEEPMGMYYTHQQPEGGEVNDAVRIVHVR